MSEFRKRLSAVFTASASNADYSQEYTPSTSSSFIHRDIFSPTKPSSAPGGPAVQGSSSSPDDLSEEEVKSNGSNVTRRRQPSLAAKDESSLTSPSKLDRWNKKLEQYPFLGFLEKRTGLRKVYIASFLLGLFALLVFRGIGMSVITVLVGFIYPLHMSLKTIENCTSLFEEISGENRHKHTEEQIKEKRGEIVGQLRKWLVYWVVYGLFNILESLSDFSLSWLPIYHPLKLIFLLWCFLPQYQGSQLVFDIVVRPVLLRHEATIEQGVETAQQAAKFSVNRVGRVVRAKSIQLTQAIQKTVPFDDHPCEHVEVYNDATAEAWSYGIPVTVADIFTNLIATNLIPSPPSGQKYYLTSSTKLRYLDGSKITHGIKLKVCLSSSLPLANDPASSSAAAAAASSSSSQSAVCDSDAAAGDKRTRPPQDSITKQEEPPQKKTHTERHEQVIWNGRLLTIVRELGQGGTAMVSEVQLPGTTQHAAVKQSDSDSVKFLAAEYNAFNSFQQADPPVPHIPKLEWYAPPLLCITPVGTVMKPDDWKAKHVLQLLEYAERVSQLGHVDRDIRPENIMLDSRTGNLIKIDLGAVVPAGATSPYHGTIYFAPNSILKACAKHHQKEDADWILPLIKAKPKHMFHAIVRIVFFVLTTPNNRRMLNSIPPEDHSAIMDLWLKFMHPQINPRWEALLEAAQKCDVTELKKMSKMFYEWTVYEE